MQIEYPIPEDAKDMVDLVRRGFPEIHLRTTIYGCPGITNFIADNIRLGRHSAYLYQVAKYRGTTVGMAEFRFFNDTFFLNYIAVHPDFQSHGLAKTLLKTAILSNKSEKITRFSLDVYTHNHRVVAWYEALGMCSEFERDVWVSPNPPKPCPIKFQIPDYAQSESVHARLGFSELTIFRDEKSIKIGRLGSTYFRIPSEILLEDSEWLIALSQLDLARELITSVLKPAKFSGQWAHVLSTRRMSANIQEITL